ncbi:protein FAF-like, chloroplastic isoform X2 [Olea europaea var. sylvestris]|nr:protein FAF-like, chloroplastic isoform X2 [Olea europaea var. sylvestris]
MKTDLDTDVAGRSMNNRRREMSRETAEKIYPPPIPWLARTGNFPSHMPWVMNKYYTNDGRLIIREEKVKRHEYFEAHRSNGRLILNLIPSDDEVDDDDDQIDEIDGQDTRTEEDQMEENEEMVMEESDQCGGGTGCCSMGANPQGFPVAVPPFRPVHS